ncbi:hypothetical protein [Clostridium sp.]|nr:hypothetical protein [Clostridium sp.]
MAKWQWCLVGDDDVLLTGWQASGGFLVLFKLQWCNGYRLASK